ncbi:MAG: hypothetical protein IPI70_15040 [Nitrospira sp.]|nr:hypothetical protein [Nitrospira sp.]
MIKLTGPAFPDVDNREMSLMLVEHRLTDAAMFTAQGEVVQPSEILHNKPILVERGSFRPATNLTVDLLNRALDQFTQHPSLAGQRPVVLAEMTLRSLEPRSDADHRDFLARAEILAAPRRGRPHLTVRAVLRAGRVPRRVHRQTHRVGSRHADHPPNRG